MSWFGTTGGVRRFRAQVALSWFALVAVLVTLLAQSDLKFSLIAEKLPFMLGLRLTPDGFIQGMALTLFITACSMVFSALVGVLTALGRLSSNPVAFALATFYASLFRGTPSICDQVLAARRAFQAGSPLPRTADVFEEIEQFLAAAQAANAPFPSFLGWLVENVRAAGAVLGGIPAAERRPIHGDGNVSNILISDAGEIRLIDWDRATTADPLEDIGSFLVEAHAGEPEARDTFTRYFGGFDDRLFNRARLYGIADDLRWGLIGSLLAAKSRRVTLEFYKFASWRYLRCRMAIREPRFAERLRRI